MGAPEHSKQMGNYARLPVVFVRGEGWRLWDDEGLEYLDFLSGLAVLNVGHSHPKVVEAVQRQVAELSHVSNLLWTEPAEQLATELSRRSLEGCVFFCNSGAEANEAAIKLARAHSFRSGRQAKDIVVFEQAFHGRTMGALSATPQEGKQAPFAPLLAGFRVAEKTAASVDALVDDHVAAVIVEPIQGESGVHVIPDDVLEAARAACDRVGALLVFDEVQTGIGRTGSMFAYEQTPVKPDLMTLAKALGGGLPIGALVTAEPYGGVLQPGDHGSTFGGNAVTCAAALAVLAVIDEQGLIENARDNGAVLAAGLAEFGAVRGRGMMLAVEIEGDAPQLVRRALVEHRLILNATGPHTLRFLPPLTIGAEQIERCLSDLRTLGVS